MRHTQPAEAGPRLRPWPRQLLSLLLLLAGVARCQSAARRPPGVGVHDYREADAARHFSAFKRDYARDYGSAQADTYRFGVFKSNMRRAAAQQRLNPAAEFGVTSLVDLTEAEFGAYHRRGGEAAHVRVSSAGVPAARSAAGGASAAAQLQAKATVGAVVDWVERGAVTAVRNQGWCGDCWAHAVVANVEGQWKLAGHPLTKLSVQQLTSCNTLNHGCNGGPHENGFKWLVESNHGRVDTEKSYPFKSKNGTAAACAEAGRVVGANITGYLTGAQLGQGEEGWAAWCEAHGPMAIGVDATTWMSYRGGVLTACKIKNDGHSVTVVGFNRTAPNSSWWKIKNSYGRKWGEEGFIRLKFGAGCVERPASATV